MTLRRSIKLIIHYENLAVVDRTFFINSGGEEFDNLPSDYYDP